MKAEQTSPPGLAGDPLASSDNAKPRRSGARAFTIAMAGNPNSGKTTLFNAITGARQHVGNYPGVTVEKKQGRRTHRETVLTVVDLPGTYSLTPHSTDELVARSFILDERPDLVINVLDASNLERNLYLAMQLLELGVPMVLALNMSDVAQDLGIAIDAAKLSHLLGVPVIATVGHRKEGLNELLDAAVALARLGRAEAISRQHVPNYGPAIEAALSPINMGLARAGIDEHARHLALGLLEHDASVIERLMASGRPQAATEVVAAAQQAHDQLQVELGHSIEIALTQKRYLHIADVCRQAVRVTRRSSRTVSDRIDTVLTHRYLGLPIFALVMYLLFQMTFSLGNPVVDYLDGLKGDFAAWVLSAWPENTLGLLRSLAVDGVIEGVGAVLVFVPLIVLLYLGIAILEDTGYLARASYVLDGLMHHVGLHGKSFIPMLIGFGCTVPAIMATRILETRRDRLTTIMVLPLMSCGARLPVYVLLLGAFFSPKSVLGLFQNGTDSAGAPMYLLSITNQALVLLALYALGIVLAIVGARLMRMTLLRGSATPFMMELPPYRLPSGGALALSIWQRGSMYVRKAGTVILAIVIILWALKTYPQLPAEQVARFEQQSAAISVDAALSDPQREEALAHVRAQHHSEALAHSVIGRLGRSIEPVVRPLGFDWRISTAILGSMAAKEVFVGQMGVIYSLGEDEDSLRSRLAADYTPLQGLCMMLFVLISAPCVATLAVTAKEAGSWKWAALQWGYLMVLAWAVTAATFQVGRLLGVG